MNLTPGSDGNLSKDALDQVYTIFLNQSGNQTSRPSDKDDQNPTGKLGKISYALDGGTLADGSLTEYGSADYGYAPPKPTKKGFAFAGWSPASIPADSTGNITFTAQWEESSTELLDGESINVKMKKLAGTGSAKYTTKNTAITAIQRTDEKPTKTVMADYDSLISTNASTKPVYAWFENGVIKWWSEAEDVNAGVNLSRLCYEMQNLTDISGLNEWQTGQVTDMSSMFYNCSKLTDLTALTNWQKKYLDFLRAWLKDKDYVALAYMTGILPIKKYGSHSALNMFTEYSMTDPGDMAEYFGFTEQEVSDLCKKYQMSFDEAKQWYDGYDLIAHHQSGDRYYSMYSPKSVVEAMLRHKFGTYWNQTETYEALKIYIQMDMDGLQDSVVRMLAGESVSINIGTFSNDMTTFATKDDILTLLVHLGYLTYDSIRETAAIPNKEVSQEYVNAISTMNSSI